MEFWLIQGNEKLQLPVPPKDYTVTKTANNQTFNVENVGEISFIGKSNLITLPAIETFFPNQNYSFCQYSTFPIPSDCVALIDKWINSGKPIRYTVTGTSINMECTIESFEYMERDGTGDIFFTLELKEYRRIILDTMVAGSGSSQKTIATALKRVITKEIPKTYTVKTGDTLSLISKKVYGNSSKWQDLYNKNKSKIKNPSMIYLGQVLIV